MPLTFNTLAGAPLWPASGLAVFLLLLSGWRLWPAIALGAFAFSMTSSGLPLLSALVAGGNTLSALTTWYWLVCSREHIALTFERASDVFRFAVVAAVAPVPGALLGTVSIIGMGLAPGEEWLPVAVGWWLADMVGILVVTPLLSLWSDHPSTAKWWFMSGEGIAALAVVALSTWLVFGDTSLGRSHYPIPFAVIPPILWAAFRLSTRETATAVSVMSMLAVLGTAGGFGPFVSGGLVPLQEALLILQLFVAMCSVGALAVSAEVTWRAATARQLRAFEIMRAHSRIASDLHDNVGASLSRIALLAEVARQKTAHTSPEVASALISIGENAREVIDDMSDAIWFIDVADTNAHELIVRLRTVATSLFEGHVECDVQGDAALREVVLSTEQRRHLYLSAKEALTNVHRHARATRVTLQVAAVDRRIRLEIIDDGVGVPGGDAFGTGRGMMNMRDRADALGGRCSITTTPGAGTRVTIEAPL